MCGGGNGNCTINCRASWGSSLEGRGCERAFGFGHGGRGAFELA